MSETAVYPVIMAESNQTFPVSMSLDEGIVVSIDESIQIVDADAYEGNYVVTPASVAQVLNTKDLMMTDDLIVEAIPSNYGLVTWNGSYLTVS